MIYQNCPQEIGQTDSRLGANLETNTTLGRLGVVDGLGTRLDVRAHAVIVACRERVEVTKSVDGDRVLRRGVAEGRSVTRNAALLDVVRRLRSDEEAITANDSVRLEGGALCEKRMLAYKP
jgi:hypothetical protein